VPELLMFLIFSLDINVEGNRLFVKRHPVPVSSESIYQISLNLAVNVNPDASAATFGMQAHANLISECAVRDSQSKKE